MNEISQDDYPRFSAAWLVAVRYKGKDPAMGGFLRVLSRYNRALWRGDFELANSMFDVEPPVTGVEIIDKGIAAVPMEEPWCYSLLREESLKEYEDALKAEDLGYDDKSSYSKTMLSRKILLRHNDMDG